MIEEGYKQKQQEVMQWLLQMKEKKITALTKNYTWDRCCNLSFFLDGVRVNIMCNEKKQLLGTSISSWYFSVDDFGNNVKKVNQLIDWLFAESLYRIKLLF